MLSKMFNTFIEMRQRSANKKVIQYLHTMNERELKDLGITRGEIEQFVNGE